MNAKALAAEPESVAVARPRRASAFRLAPLAATTLLAGLGLLICAYGETLSRGLEPHAMEVYWVGVLVMALPIFYRLTGRDATPTERLALVCLLGMSLYLIKVMRDSPVFTFNDELIHAYNANQIADHHHLFHSNPILEVTPYYPGMEGATSAIASISGLSTYVSGTILIAAARLTLMASLFFLFRRISGSPRTAGLGTAIYAGNFNFFFYGAQYSYESLALPLLLFALMLLAEREQRPLREMRQWAVPLGLGLAAIVVTHHLTSYATAGVLVALAIADAILRRTWRPPNPWRYAIFVVIIAAGWLTVVGSSTVGYLEPPLKGAFEAIFQTIGGEAPPRGLFQGGAGAEVAATPPFARALSLLAVGVLTIALPFGLVRIYHRHRRNAFAIIFALAGVGFFVTLALRLAPAAWETGNRASEFFFVGLAFVVATAGFEARNYGRLQPLARPALALALALILFGGAVSGWPWDVQLAKPVKVEAEGGTITSPPLAMAEWAAREVEGGVFAAQTADANLLLDPGDKEVFSGPSPDVEDILKEPTMPSWQLPLLRENGIEYVVVDRREISLDGIRGYYFSERGETPALFPIGVVRKFSELAEFSTIYTNGPITVFRREGGNVR
jgi:hypothetical protein